MNQQLVFIQNGRAVTDSLLVAEKFGKEHKHVMRDIRELECSEEFRQSNFGLSTYVSGQNKGLPKVEMTRDGFTFLVMGYTGSEAARFKEDYIKAFNMMEQQIMGSINLSQLSPQLQHYIYLEQRANNIENDVSQLKQVVDNEVWITEAQRGQLRTAVNNRAGQLLNTGYGNAHFQGIYSTLKTHFGVAKYDKIPRKDFELALDIVRGWYPKIREAN
ncbi:Rha family transcriptional regulator [Paenibacillus sp. ACRRX]|uniref:Rha family transcriptional regulator n=1 Tax=Paenibacillus sp. ACRRX TaxID=2918206 RepID=UPI001EF64947|nr:Rha family transcriptional regulator [Paenibacillus sp. ACRRX]MCG7406737.1 Rha family transcriptional regulator [Paenibacillus sp. ACRRX]